MRECRNQAYWESSDFNVSWTKREMKHLPRRVLDPVETAQDIIDVYMLRGDVVSSVGQPEKDWRLG